MHVSSPVDYQTVSRVRHHPRPGQARWKETGAIRGQSRVPTYLPRFGPGDLPVLSLFQREQIRVAIALVATRGIQTFPSESDALFLRGFALREVLYLPNN
jgi:hypothetical protein